MHIDKLNISHLFKSGVHFGHLNRLCNSKMKPYIYNVNYDISIINLDKTLSKIRQAMFFAKSIALNNGKILFVGTKKQIKDSVKKYAELCGMPYINNRWLGGVLTNYRTIKQSVKKLNSLEKMFEDNSIEHLSKKEKLDLKKILFKLQSNLGGVKNTFSLPDALFVIDVNRERTAVKEANRVGIPVIGIVDTNSDPDGVDYIIPGNDDSISSVSLYLEIICNIILQYGKSSFKK